jgi:hypothetical protein
MGTHLRAVPLAVAFRADRMTAMLARLNYSGKKYDTHIENSCAMIPLYKIGTGLFFFMEPVVPTYHKITDK